PDPFSLADRRAIVELFVALPTSSSENVDEPGLEQVCYSSPSACCPATGAGPGGHGMPQQTWWRTGARAIFIALLLPIAPSSFEGEPGAVVGQSDLTSTECNGRDGVPSARSLCQPIAIAMNPTTGRL